MKRNGRPDDDRAAAAPASSHTGAVNSVAVWFPVPSEGRGSQPPGAGMRAQGREAPASRVHKPYKNRRPVPPPPPLASWKPHKGALGTLTSASDPLCFGDKEQHVVIGSCNATVATIISTIASASASNSTSDDDADATERNYHYYCFCHHCN